MTNFSKNLYALRRIKNITQKDLASKLNVTQASISQFEKGKRIPSIGTLKMLAKELDVSINDLEEDFNKLKKKETINKLQYMSVYSLEKINEYADFLLYKERK